MADRLMSFGLLAATLVLSLLAFPSHAAAQERRLMIFEGADYSGFDYRTEENVDLEACKAACLADQACKAFTYNTNAAWCFLKSDFGPLTTFAGAVAGRVTAGAEAPKDGPALDLSFLPDSTADDGERLRRSVVGERPAPNLGFAGAIDTAANAITDGDPRLAVASLRAALSLDGDSYQAWLDLARALLAVEPRDYNERYDLPEQAGGAAYNAIGHATNDTERALALAVMGDVLQRRQIWRPAIESYRTSLALAEIASVRERFTEVRAEHGFRMIDYTVDSDAAVARACIQFSEELAGGAVDIADYVTLDGVRPPAVTRETQQLCVDGLEHGRRYRVGLRAGLPSTVGEVLEQPVELAVYVRDRSPSVRFTGRNYVLPRAGARGLPLVSVNSRLVQAEIYRIGARGLAGTMRDNEFLDQLNGYSASNIAERRGERIWKGEMPVAMDINREVVTAFPIDEVLSDPEPGVYVMTAWADEGASEEWEQRATQWFIVTDIGLATLMADDGLHVFARSLATAEPIAGLEVSLVAAGNDELGRLVTDDTGHVRFAPGLTRGEGGMAPAVVIADGGGDSAFLDLTAAPFDLADRGVAGRPAPGPVDVFAYSERGVYRPGETVHLVALARDSAAAAVDVPLTIIVERPDGVEYQRVISNSTDFGGHALDIALDANVMTGTWRAAVHGDPDAAPLAEVSFLVEDFVPERLDFDLAADREVVVPEAAVPLTVAGRFLYGAPAAGLGLEGEAAVRPARTAPEGFTGYRFGLADEDVTPVRRALEGLPATDDEGNAAFEARLPSPPQTTGRLEAEFVVRMREAGGRAVERSLTLPVRPSGPLIGLHPLFDDDEVAEDALAGFEVVAVTPDLERTSLGTATWQLIKLERRYEWYRLDGRWNYEAVTSSRRIDAGEVELAADSPARITVPVEWGRYRLEVTGPGAAAPVSSIDFTAGWYAADAQAETPDILDIALDKPSYRPGETAHVRLSPRFAGTALVTVMAESVVAMKAVSVAEDGGTIDFPVDDAWGAGAYVTAMLYRPMSVDAGQNPARAVGVDWLEMDTSAREIGVTMEVPEVADPRSTLGVPVTLAGLEPGEPARVAVAAVDVGILNLTGYQPPEPEAWYFGQRALGVEIRDLYGRLIDGLQGVRGEIRSGGGESGMSMNGAPPTETPVSLFSGIVEAGGDGTAEVVFDLPAFNGTLRMMAVAWTATKVGHGVTDVVVRDPVVMTASLPRFLAPGDATRLWLDVDNVAGPAGTWQLDVGVDGPIEAVLSPEISNFDLGAGERRALVVPITASEAGHATLAVHLSHADGIAFDREYNLTVRPAQPPITRRNLHVLAPGGDTFTLTPDLVADLVPGSATTTLAVNRGLLIDVPGLLEALDRYPYGCSEQITSRALPLVYLNEVARELGIAPDAELAGRIDDAIARVLQRQSSSGAFGLWGVGGDDLWLDAYVSDFLTRAREVGHEVPERAFGQALDRLENGLAYVNDVSSAGEGIAYALYVLARNRRASIGDLRYYADAQLDEFGSPLARAQLAAALGLYGDNERASRVFANAVGELQGDTQEPDWREDYGSRLRDSAATLTLVAEANAPSVALPAVARLVERERERKSYTSTQENAWLLLVAHALQDEGADIAVALDGTRHEGRLLRRFPDAEIRAGPVTVANAGEAEFQVIVTTRGVPVDPEPARSNGLTIERSYYTLDGQPVGSDEFAQNERFVTVVRVGETRARRARLLVEDFLPAGLEIDNPRLVSSGDAGALAWLGDTANAEHVEFRDDRFVAALDRSGSEAETLTLAYIVRAVTPGRYAHPPAVVEDMYAPEVNARTALSTLDVIGPSPR